MGYEIVDDYRGREIGAKRIGKVIVFTSETLVGLHEEIDRYVKEENPRELFAISRELVPQYVELVKRTPKGYESKVKGSGRWVLRLKPQLR